MSKQQSMTTAKECLPVFYISYQAFIISAVKSAHNVLNASEDENICIMYGRQAIHYYAETLINK